MQFSTLMLIRELSTDKLAEVALRLATVDESTFLKLMHTSLHCVSQIVVQVRDSTVTYPESLINELRWYNGDDEYVRMVNRIRAVTGSGLFEAKHSLDLLQQEGYMSGKHTLCEGINASIKSVSNVAPIYKR